MYGVPTYAELAAMLMQMERSPGAMSFMIPAIPVIMNNPRLNTPWWEMWRDMYDDSVVLLLKPPTLTASTFETLPTFEPPTFLPTF
ncbi:MAG: hypothetical protein V1695_04075 [Candidatus Uhrbacteria bacterium]